MIHRQTALWGLTTWLALTCAAAVEKPTFEALYPAGAPAGTTNQISLAGKVEPWPPKIWASNPALGFEFSTNKGTAQLCIASNAVPGPCLVRLYNEAGASELRIFVVGSGPEVLEVEPNNHFSKPQAIPHLPAMINGRLEKNGDVDSYALEIKTGQWLDGVLDCYTLLAKLDPALRLVTTNGYQLAWNHDFSSLDPRLIWRAPSDTTVVLQVFGFAYPADSDIRLSGAPADVYRLALSVADSPPPGFRDELTEREPNDLGTNAPLLSLPLTIAGVIASPADVDRFRVQLEKAQTVDIRVLANQVGSPLDAWVAVEAPAGKELARNDDADNSRDPHLEFKSPEKGIYMVVVGSLTHQGNADYRYRLQVQELEPDYRLTSLADALVLEPGSTNTLKLKIQRLRGFTNDLTLATSSLPERVTSSLPAVPGGDGELTLTFMTATNAPPFSGPFHVMVRDKITQRERPVAFDLVSRSENNGVPGGYSKLLVESTDQLWLTVKPLPKKD